MGVWLQGCGCACVCVWLCASVWDSVFVCSCISVYILPHTQFTHQEPQHSHGTWKGSTLFWTWKTVYLCVCMYGCVCVTVGDDSVYVTVWGWRCGCSCVCVCVWLYVWLCVDVAVGGLCMCMTVCDYVHLCWPHDCDCVWLCVIVCVCLQRTPWLSIWMGSRNPFFLLVIPQQPSVCWLLQLWDQGLTSSTSPTPLRLPAQKHTGGSHPVVKRAGTHFFPTPEGQEAPSTAETFCSRALSLS